METVTLARNTMNTRFELVLTGGSPVSLRAAGEEALSEVERIENQLSLFKPGSEIAQVNAQAAEQPVRVSPEVFYLLQHAARLTRETEGAFDITLAPLLRCWGLLGRRDGNLPAPEALTAARAMCGMDLVELRPANRTVRFVRPGVMLDLGAIGKGYAIDRAVEVLRETGVNNALIHGGTSTVYALGHPPEAGHWRIAIGDPLATATDYPSEIALRDESLSVSAVSAKCFTANGRVLGHIIDPRTGEPATRAWLTAVVLPSATETDALSTALLVRGADGFAAVTSLRNDMRALLVPHTPDRPGPALLHGFEPISHRTV